MKIKFTEASLSIPSADMQKLQTYQNFDLSRNSIKGFVEITIKFNRLRSFSENLRSLPNEKNKRQSNVFRALRS